MIQQHHTSYRQWLQELNFYEDEIIIFQKELNLIVSKHPELMSIIEHVNEYQKIFEKKISHLKSLQDQIMEKEKELASLPENGNIPNPEFEEIRQKEQHFVQNFEELKKNFKRFVAKNMH